MPTTSSEHCAPEDIGSSTVVDSRTGSRSHDLGRTLGLRPSVVRWGLARHRCVPAAPLRPRRVRKQAGITHRAPSRPCRQAPAARLAHWQGDSVKEQRLWSGPMSRPRLRLSARPSLSSPPRRHRSSSGGPLLVFPACHPGSSTNQSNCPWTNRVPFPSRDTGCGARGDGHRILPSDHQRDMFTGDSAGGTAPCHGSVHRCCAACSWGSDHDHRPHPCHDAIHGRCEQASANSLGAHRQRFSKDMPVREPRPCNGPQPGRCSFHGSRRAPPNRGVTAPVLGEQSSLPAPSEQPVQPPRREEDEQEHPEFPVPLPRPDVEKNDEGDCHQPRHHTDVGIHHLLPPLPGASPTVDQSRHGTAEDTADTTDHAPAG